MGMFDIKPAGDDHHDPMKVARRRARKIVEDAREEAVKIIAEATGKEVEEIKREIALDIEEAAIVQIKEMSASLESQIQSSLEAAKVEIENYKKSRMESIDTELRRRVDEIAKGVIGESIDLKTHEELIIKAVEDAKRGGIF